MKDSEDYGLCAVSPLYVDRGLFALRYVSAEDPNGWPSAEVFLPTGPGESMRQIFAPGASPGRLPGPGACIVLYVEDPGLVRIGLRPATPNGSLRAVIKLERLDLERSKAPLAASVRARHTTLGRLEDKAISDPPEFSLLAHIARRGDVDIASGQWAGGPDAPARIEGFLIKPHVFDTVNLELQVLSLGSPGWSSWCGAGVFVGTRKRSAPLIGVRARLVGPMAHCWTLFVEAMFLGSPLIVREGREIELRGTPDADPLVGLRFEVKAAPAIAATTAPPDEARGPRGKIFRISGAGR